MYKKYQEYIKTQLALKPEEWDFKNNNYYREILEHINFEQGIEHLNIIKNTFKCFYESNFNFLQEICGLNDKYGKTYKYHYENFMICSPSNLRYILHSLLILEDMKKHNLINVDIIEIGGGYGGLCLFIHHIAPLYKININSYSIFDLLEASQIQEKYLNVMNIKNVHFCQLDNLNNLTNLKNNSFLISNYAFSEISKDLQIKYIEKIINPYTIFGFLAWNAIPVYEFIENSVIVKEKEYPITGTHNYFVRFKKKTSM